MVPSPTCSTGPPPGHPRFQVQLLGEGGWSCVQDSSAGGTSSPDAWAQLHQPPLLARRGVPSSRGRPGEHVATSRGPRPSAWWAGRPPASEQHSQFTKRVHRRARGASGGLRSAVPGRSDAADGNPEAQRWEVAAAGLQDGSRAWAGPGRLCRQHARSRLPQAAPGCKRGVVLGSSCRLGVTPYSSVRPAWGFGVARRT